MTTPTANVTPSRTSGVAPLGVVFDATGTTDADVASPFRDLLYLWNFGDSEAGTWEYGANTAQSKNFATGAVAAHVYETPGTYTWTCVVWDGTTADVETGTVTVTDPDTVFSTTNTVVVSNGTDFTGKPAGAQEVPSTTDFDATLATYAGSGKRVLFKRGDTFVSSATGNLSAAGAMTVGAWGSGDLPIINATNIAGVININNTAVNDLRVMDLDIRGNGATDTGTAVLVGAAAIDNVTLLRLTVSEIGKGMVVTAGGVPTGFVVQDCNVYNWYASGGNGWFGKLFTSALMGNNFGPIGGGSAEHVVRIGQGVKVAVTNNNLQGAAAKKHNLTLRADTHVTTAEDTQYVVISDNKFFGDSATEIVHIRPSADSVREDIYDVIAERNWIINGSLGATGVIITASRVTVRNNIFDMSNRNSTVSVSISMDNTAGIPTPDDNRIYNNTIYSAFEGTTIAGVIIDTEPTATVVVNNLAYAPNTASGDMISGTGTSPGAMTNNSTDGDITGTDPQFVGPLTSAIGFTVSAASYAANGGTASFPAQQSDFFNAFDKSGDNRMGAIVQNGEQQIKGVAA